MAAAQENRDAGPAEVILAHVIVECVCKRALIWVASLAYRDILPLILIVQ